MSVGGAVESLPPGSGVRSASGFVDGGFVVDLERSGKTAEGESTWKMHYQLLAIYSFLPDSHASHPMAFR